MPAGQTQAFRPGDTDSADTEDSPPPGPAVAARGEMEPASLALKLVKLGVLRQDQWDAAVRAVGPDADLHAILRQLAGTPSGREIRGQSLPILTDFQIRQIVTGNAERLRLGHHLILDKLGAGGMGEVFKVWNLNLQRPEAIKTVLSDGGGTSATGSTHARDRFEREARVLGQLDHPNITTIYQFGREHGIDFLAMEFVSGQDMKSIVEEANAARDPVPIWWAVERIIATAEALQHAHDKGVIHRDIKPSNLMITDEEDLKVLDMGIARLVSPGSADGGTTRLTQVAVGLGTPEVMSPEQWADATAVTPESDIYSLGCTFYYVLAGQMPFRADNLNGLMFAHVNDPPPPLSSIRKDVPRELEAVVNKMLAKEPRDRYRSCRELIDALAPFTKDGGARTGGGGKSRGPLFIAVAALAGIIVALGGILALPYIMGERDQNKRGPVVDWKKKVEVFLTKHQFENKEAWPNPENLTRWLGDDAAAGVGSQEDLDSLEAKVIGQTQARIATRAANEALLATELKANGTVWDEKSLKDQFDQVVDAEAFSDPEKGAEVKDALSKLTAARWRAETDRRIADLQTAHGKVWKSPDLVIEFAKGKQIDLDAVDTDAEMNQLVDTLARETWRRKTEDWIDEFQAKHRKVWPTTGDVLGFIGEITTDQGIADGENLEKVKKAVRQRTKELIQKWVEDWLATYRMDNEAIWPDLDELKDRANSLVALDELDEDPTLENFTMKVVELTRALEHPFEGLKPISDPDSPAGAATTSLLKVYELLTEAMADPARPPAELDFDTYIGDERSPLVPVGERYYYKVRSDRPGYLTILSFGSDGLEILLQYTGELVADELTKAIGGEAKSEGTDRVIAFLTDTNPLDHCPKAGEPIANASYGSLVALVFHRFAQDPRDAKQTDLKLARDAFSYPLVFDRVREHLTTGNPYPGLAPGGRIKLLARKAIDVRVIGNGN